MIWHRQTKQSAPHKLCESVSADCWFGCIIHGGCTQCAIALVGKKTANMGDFASLVGVIWHRQTNHLHQTTDVRLLVQMVQMHHTHIGMRVST